MDQTKALDILRTLANGIDPHTGESFAPDSPYQHPDTVRALYWAIHAIEANAAKARTVRPAPANAGKPWTKEEDSRLFAGFEHGETIEMLAAAHGRSRVAIEARLAKFGKVPPPHAMPSTRFKAKQPVQSRYAAFNA